MIEKVFNKEAGQRVLLSSINLMEETIGCTLGPNGLTVIIDQEGKDTPIITKDGVTVAKNLKLLDKELAIGVKLIRDIAQKTADDAGDGTTTSVILAANLLKEYIHYIGENKVNPIMFKNELKEALVYIKDYIDKHTYYINNNVEGEKALIDLCSISANNDYVIGELVGKALFKAGKHVTVDYKKSNNLKWNVEIVEGYHCEGRLYDKSLLDTVDVLEINNAVFVVLYEELQNFDSKFSEALATAVQKNVPLVVMATDFSSTAMQTAYYIKKTHPQLKDIVLLKTPSFGELSRQITEDIVAYCGLDLHNTSDTHSYSIVDKIIATKKDITFINNIKSEKALSVLKHRTTIVQKKIEELKEGGEKERLTSRLNSLLNKTVIITVGGDTEVEQEENYYRVEDAIKAGKQALLHGYVVGGGATYFRAGLSLLNNQNNCTNIILYNTLKSPLTTLFKHSGLTLTAEHCETLEKNQFLTYNLQNCVAKETNGIEAGIIDSKTTAIAALTNAISIASLILSTGSILLNAQLGENRPHHIGD